MTISNPYSPGDVSRLYTRAPPYSVNYPTRYQSPNNLRTAAMSERDIEAENSVPRKRVSMACSRCRKRKIRCSGDPGHGGACTNCKSAQHEPCMFLRMHATETRMRENNSNTYNYNSNDGRAYQSRSAMSPSVTGYGPGSPSADMLGHYRQQQPFPYATRGSYANPSMAGWPAGATAYPDDVVDYTGYTQYPVLSQESVQMVPAYPRYNGNRPLYVESEVAGYNYHALTHRQPQDTTGFTTLTSMSSPMPGASDRGVLHGNGGGSTAGRSMTGYTSRTSVGSSPESIADSYAAGGFDSPISYSTAPTPLPSNDGAYRGVLQSDGVDSIYTVDPYSYGHGSRDHSRRDSLASCSPGAYPSEPNHVSAMPTTPYTLPASSTTSSAASPHDTGSYGEPAAASVSRRGSGSHDSSNASSGHAVYDTRPLGSLRGNV